MSLIDLFKGFHYRSTLEGFPPSARVLYFVLIGEFNARFWQTEISYSVRELSGLTGLSIASVHRATKFLADRAYIKTWRKGNRTIFRLLGDVPQNSACNENAELSKQTCNNLETQTERSALFATPIHDNARAHAVSLLPATTHEDTDIDTDNNHDARAHDTNEVDELIEYWERDLRGGRLSFEHMSELSVWLKTKGYDFVKEAMRETSDLNNNPFGLSFKLMRKVYEGKVNPQPLKGGERIGKADNTVAAKVPTRIEYEEPDYNSPEYDAVLGRTRKPNESD